MLFAIGEFIIQQFQLISMEKNKQEVHFILFVNTKSGDGYGASYLQLGSEEIMIKYSTSKKAYLYISDLFDADSRKRGVQLISTFYSEETIDFRVIVCGGDGTIPWVLTQLLSAGLDLAKIVFGIIPIGTGNDFSRSLGWGAKPVKVTPTNFRQLAVLVKQWMNSTIGFYDMWDVKVQTFDNGKIYDTKDQKEIERSQNSFKKMFSNYVGMGLDARVVYTVERHRTPIAFLNKVVYGFIGFLNFFRPMKKLQQTVQSVSQRNNLLNEQKQFQSSSSRRNNNSLDDNITTEEPNKIYPFKSGYCGMVCLNCTSYMAGLRKVWQTNSVSALSKDKRSFSQQKVDDGFIQFVQFKSQLNLALQRIVRSGSKAMQGIGPFEILMKKPIKDEITYMQIDGQSIKIKNLKSVIITKTEKIGDHRLRVMVNSNPVD